MRWDRICFPVLVISVCLGLIFRWVLWSKVLTVAAAVALLVSVVLTWRGVGRDG